MKRVFAVLAMMLILTLTAWNSAESRRGPALEITEVNYDHPWGGDHIDPNPPGDDNVTPITGDKLSFSSIIKNFNMRFLFNGSTFVFNGYRGMTATNTTTTTTETNITVDDSNNNNNQPSGGKGR